MASPSGLNGPQYDGVSTAYARRASTFPPSGRSWSVRLTRGFADGGACDDRRGGMYDVIGARE
jgi:hypothetical protein